MQDVKILDHFSKALENNYELWLEIDDKFLIEVGTYAVEKVWNASLLQSIDSDNDDTLITVDKPTLELALNELFNVMRSDDRYCYLLNYYQD